MRPVTAITLAEGWTVRWLGSGRLDAAPDAVAGRQATGLATAEGVELSRVVAPPTSVTAGTFTTSIPADVHMVLHAAGAIEHPHQGLNEFTTQWIGRSRWEFSTEFAVDDVSRRTELVLHGVDTVAEISLNGVLLAETNDMNVPVTIDVTSVVREGSNALVVAFAAQEDWAEDQEKLRGTYPNVYSDPTNQIRKMACNFGWDWGPTLVAAGLWKPVEILQFDCRLDQLSVVPWAEGSTGRVSIAGAVSGDAGGTLRVFFDGREHEVCDAEATFALEINVGDVELWWPRGYGAQPLHTLTVELSDATGQVIDRHTRRVGFRSVEILAEPDEHGSSWAIVVNGQRIWARGANWIPVDTSIAKVTRSDYERRIADAVEANMNIVRVWGGGIYESDDFYTLCDEAGIMVWQDALFACASYPEDDITRALVAAEVAHAARRLGSHPSLVVWNGGNETIWGFEDWGWKEPLDGRAWGLGYYLDVIPHTITTIDSSRPYTPNSPWSGTIDIHPNDPRHGTAHLWEPWNREDYPHYRDSIPRFVSEYGYQSPAAWSTLVEALGEDQLSEDSPALRAHQKALDGRAKLRRAVEKRFGEPLDFDDWHYLTQLEQARAMRLAIHHLRSHHDVCSGSIIWQLNDCWPAISWALVDVGGHRKPAWHAVRKAYNEVLLSLRGGIDDLSVVVSNDSSGAVAGPVVIEVHDMQGAIIAAVDVEMRIVSGSAEVLHLAGMLPPLDPTKHFVRARMGVLHDLAFFADDHELQYPVAKYAVTTQTVDDGVLLTIEAHSLLRDVCISPDRRDPHSRVSDSFFTLAAGESATVLVTTTRPELFGRSGWSDMIRAANDRERRR